MSEPLPLLSIFTVVKNGAKTIRRCLDSVLALDYPNFEHVIQDGLSTDGTLEILAEYARRHPDVIKLVSEADSCAEEGFFRGLKRCQGKYIGSCLADEALLPQAGKWAVGAFAQHPQAGAVYGDLFITDEAGNIQSEFKAPHPFTLEKYLLHEVNPPFASSFFRRGALDNIALATFPWSYDMGEFELWIRLSSRHPVHYVPGAVATYAVHPDQRSCRKEILLKLFEARCQYLPRLFAEKPIQKRFGPIYPQVMGGLHLFVAEVLRDSGSYQEAAELLSKSVPYRPNAEPFKRLLHGFFNQGMTLFSQKRLQDAIICWAPLATLGIEIPQLAEAKRQLNRAGDHYATWQAGVPAEVQFWREWLGKLARDHSITDRLDRNKPLQTTLRHLLALSHPAPTAAPFSILDVGSGPLTSLGKSWEHHDIRISAADPLAVHYNQALDEGKIVPPVRVVEAQAEKLTGTFPRASFDLITAINCLDHSYDPLQAILQAVQVVKPGGFVLLAHERREGENEGYRGLHQWNFDLENGDFVIWSPTRRYNVTSALRSMAEVSCEISDTREFVDSDNVLIVRIRRNALPAPGAADNPLVSVIVLSHNYAAHLPKAVASVVAQTFTNFEIIIVDDGSTDDSLKIANELADRHQPSIQIRVFHLDDVGPSAARRFGVGQARGRYFVPLDADDRLAPEYLEKTVPVLEADPRLGFAYVDPIYFGDAETRYYMPEYDFARLCQENFISYCALVRRSAFAAVDGYDRANWGYFEDWDLWIRLGYAGWHGRHVAESLFYYQQHFNSSLSFYSLRLAPIYRAYIISHRPQLYPADAVTRAQEILAEMPTDWHALPPLRDVGPIGRLLEKHPGNRHLRYFLAFAQARSGSPGEAITTLTNLLAEHPSDDQARQALEKFCRETGTAPAARIHPGSSGEHSAGPAPAERSEIEELKTQARAEVVQENWEAAADLCARAVHVAPNDAENLNLFAHALANLNRFDDALKVARRLVELQPDETAYSALAEALAASVARLAPGSLSGAEPPLRGRRVLVYTDDPGQGGAAHYNHSILKALGAGGAHVFCAQPKGDGTLSDKQAESGVVHIWTGYNPVVEFTRSFVDEDDARRIYDLARPDLVFFSDCCALSHIAAKQVAITLGIPFAVICHSEAAYLADRFPQCLPVVKEQLALAAAVISVSASSLGVLRRHFGLAPDKGTVIYSGCPEAYFAPVESDARMKLRAELRIPDDGVLCLTAARLDGGKCHHLQLEAIRRLRDGNRLGALHFAWAGDGELRQTLELAVKSHGLDDRVHILGYRWDVMELMGASDVFILSTLHEALPLCIMEAMARGLPVIASAVGGIPEELGDTGILLPDPNLDPQATVVALTESLSRLAQSESQRKKLGSAGRARAQALFKQGRMTDDTLNVLGAALAERSPVVAHVPPPAQLTSAAGEASSPTDPHASSASNGSPMSPEFFQADEVRNIDRLVSAYTDKPFDPDANAQIRALQEGLMSFLLSAETEKLEGLFNGNFSHVFRALLKCGLTSEPLSESSQVQLATLDEAITGSEHGTGVFDFRLLLARMIFAPAHRGAPVTCPLEKIPGWLLADYLGYVLHAPPVFVAAGEAELYHTHLLGWARAIHQSIRTAPGDPLTSAAASFFTGNANYIPLYLSGQNTREAAEKRAAIIEFTLRQHGAVIDAILPRRPQHRRKIKVGFLSAHFGAQTETHVTLPALQLDRNKFEVCLFAVGRNPGPVEDHCRSLADSFTVLPADLHQQVQAIRAAALDAIIVGTNVTAVTNQVSLIATHRLAPRQLVSYCSPVSTGMRHIDGYLTGTFCAGPGLQQHFTEQLHFCEGPPGCLDYSVEGRGGDLRFDRPRLGIADDEVVFLNAAACFKILPEMLDTWARILQAVPKSRLLLLPFNPNWASDFPVKQFTRILNEAFQRHGLAADRFILAKSLRSRAEVKELEKVADVYLDTFPFSGSIAVIDPLELGIPVVTREGTTTRSRAAAALLRDLDLPELITQDEPSYRSTAVKLGTDAGFRRQIGTRILAGMAGKPRFVDPAAYGRQLGDLLERLVLGGGKQRDRAEKSRQATAGKVELVA